jgi:DNA-binding MarR family transcriptional regulator
MTTPDDIPQLWETLTNQLVFLEKRYVFRHGELDLHPSELHLLLAIKDEPEANATKLAGRLGVTKGAVSQLLKKLEAKGVIEKTSDPAQKNEITSTFTRLGKAAITAFLKSRESQHRRFAAYLAALSPAEKKAIRGFLAEMPAYLPSAD